jgi:hypothetical protein
MGVTLGHSVGDRRDSSISIKGLRPSHSGSIEVQHSAIASSTELVLGLAIVQPNPRSQLWVDPQAGITHPGSCARNLSQIILANRVESSCFQEMFTLVSTPSFVIYFSEETKKAHQ